MAATPQTETPPMLGRTTRKRLIVCCDGTWQSSTSVKKNVPSNVTRLARSFAREGVDPAFPGTVWEQVVYYDAGIGTGEISESEKKRQGGYAHGFLSNIIEAYNFLVLNWYPGDKVYCFGFSRGAYTARAVAGLVNDIGIISPRDMQDFPELFRQYQDYKGENPHEFRKSLEYRNWQAGIRSARRKDRDTGLKLWDKIPHAAVPESSRVVEVVGVFDTVGSLGVPQSDFFGVKAAMEGMNLWWGGEKPGFHNVELSPYIRNAFHAMALDERRRPFTPTLWHMPDKPTFGDDTGLELTDLVANFRRVHYDERPCFMSDAHGKEAQKEYEVQVDKAWAAIIDHEMREQWNLLGNKMPQLKQVWFAGMHCNVGGGDSDLLVDRLGDFEQNALISFAWMVEQVKPFLKFEDRIRKRSVRDRMALVVPVIAEAEAKAWKDYGTWVKPLWRGLESLGLYNAVLREFGARTVIGWAEGPMPDSYTPKMKATGEQRRTPGDYRHRPDDKAREKPALGATNEYIHPSIQFRKLAHEAYDPEALKGYKREHREGEVEGEKKKQWYWTKPATQKDGWFWQAKPEIAAICVPEWPVDNTAKFSRFLTKDYTSFLKALEIDTDDRLLQAKPERTPEEQEAYEKKQEKDLPDTEATIFLNLTLEGKEWVKPVDYPPKPKDNSKSPSKVTVKSD